MKDLDDYPGLAYLLQWLRHGEDNYTKQLYRIILKTYSKIGLKVLFYVIREHAKKQKRGK